MKTNNKVYWTMRNGKKIDVDEMTIEHLRNTLKMIIRNYNTRHWRNNFIKTSAECDATEIDIY